MIRSQSFLKHPDSMLTLGQRWHKGHRWLGVGTKSITWAQRWPNISAAGYICAKDTEELIILDPFLVQHFSC